MKRHCLYAVRALAIAFCLLATPALADVGGVASVIDGDTIEVHGQRMRCTASEFAKPWKWRRGTRRDSRPAGAPVEASPTPAASAGAGTVSYLFVGSGALRGRPGRPAPRRRPSMVSSLATKLSEPSGRPDGRARAGSPGSPPAWRRPDRPASPGSARAGVRPAPSRRRAPPDAPARSTRPSPRPARPAPRAPGFAPHSAPPPPGAARPGGRNESAPATGARPSPGAR